MHCILNHSIIWAQVCYRRNPESCYWQGLQGHDPKSWYELGPLSNPNPFNLTLINKTCQTILIPCHFTKKEAPWMVEWCFETSLVENQTKMPSSGGNYFFGKIVLMNINRSQKWSNFSFRSKGLEVWGDQALLLLLSNCIINMPHSLKWTNQSIVWINSRQIMAVLSCFALFLCRPDGRVSLQGYKHCQRHYGPRRWLLWPVI